MRFFSSSRRRLADSLTLSSLGLLLASCAWGLDFDDLSSACESPRFDIPGFNQFCSGEITRLTQIVPTGAGGPDELAEYMRVDQNGTLFAMAGLSLRIDASDSSCVIYSPLITLAQVVESGEIKELGSMIGHEHGLKFVASQGNQTCSRADVDAVWVTEVEIVTTSPLQVLAAFGDGGLVSVFFSDDGRALSVHQVGGSARASIHRKCVAGACVAADGEHCNAHMDCRHTSYCDENAICKALQGCSLDAQCRVEGQTCANRRGVCTLTCREHGDCPHPLVCIEGLCGGEGCNVDLPCIGGDECRFGQCQPFCGTAATCEDGLTCFNDSASSELICAPGGTAGTCVVDDDCSIGRVTGFAVIPENPITFDTGGIAVATWDRGLRWAAWEPGSHPYFLASDDTSEEFDVFDVLWVEEHGSLYATVPSLGMIRFDLRRSLEDGRFDEDEHLHIRPLSLDPNAPLTEVVQVGMYLVTTEGGVATLAMDQGADTLSRILMLDSDPDEDLEQISTLNLGPTLQPSVARIEAQPEIWMWGVDRPEGGELLFYDIRALENPEINARLLTSSGLLRAGERDQRNWVQAIPQGALFGSSGAITPFEVEIEGAFQ